MESIKHIYPLTPLQEGIYFHYLDEKSSTYFEQVEYTIKGELELSVLHVSVEKLFERHDVLRTNFVLKPDHQILQVVSEHKAANFSFVDISGEIDKEECISRYKKVDIEDGFDLKLDVLFRLKVFKLSVNDFRIICSNHHILLDGWSRSLILNDLFEIYKAVKDGVYSKLLPPKPFRDFVISLKDKNLEESEKYWKNYLRDYRNDKNLSDIFALPKSKGFTHTTMSFSLEEREVRQFCTIHRVTVNVFVNVIWGIMLSRYAHSSDVVFGVVMSGRSADMSDIGECVGLLINTVPLRIKISEQDTLKTIVARVQHDFVSHEKHQHYPLNKILSLSKVRQKLVDHILAFENYPKVSTANTGGQDFGIMAVKSHEQTNYDFNISFHEAENIGVHFSFNKGMFPEIFVEELFSAMKTVVDETLRNVDTAIVNMGLLSNSKILRTPNRPVPVDLNSARNEVNYLDKSYQVPDAVRSDLEKILCDLWRSALEVDTLTIHDNLFDLGADSIMAIQVGIKVKRMGYELIPSSIYDHPTIRDLTTIIRKRA